METRLEKNIGTTKYKLSRFNHYVEVDETHELIYNSLAQTLSLLEEKEREILNIYRSPEMDRDMVNEEDAIIKKMLLNHFLVPADVDELARFRRRYDQERQKDNHMGLTVLTTMNCNFGCSYCFQGSDKSMLTMDDKTEKAILRLIENMSDRINSLNITWFGGEPLLSLKTIKNLSNQIIPLCDRKKIAYYSSVITNGYLLSSEVMEELYLRKVRTVQITLDGSQPVHDKIRYIKNTDIGSYDRILENIQSYCEKFPINTIIRINVDKNNVHSIYSLLDDLSARGLGSKVRVSVYFAPVEASTAACGKIAADTIDMEEFGRIEFGLYKYAVSLGLCNISLPYHMVGMCTASRANGLVILPDGELHRCWETVAQQDKRIGQLDILGSPAKNQREEEWKHFSPFNYQECAECPMLPNCAGFCAYRFLYAAEFSGNRKVPCPVLRFNIKEKLLHFVAQRDPYVARLLLKNSN